MDKYGIVRWIYEMPFGNTRMTPHELFEAIERMTLEEQNRELLRARAVSQVVRQVFLMERSADLAKAIRVMQEELHGLGLAFSLCSITIFDEKTDTLKIYRDAPEPLTKPTGNLAPSNLPEFPEMVAAWREHRVFQTNLGHDGGEAVRAILSVPFTHGTVIVGREERDAFSEDDIHTLQEFAEAISVGYKRFLDFHELDRRHRELQETQLQLIQSEKMASLGQLVAGVAHELNTPMGAINSNAQVAERALEQVRSVMEGNEHSTQPARARIDKALAHLEEMNAVNRVACRRIIRIVDNLRSFARLDEAEWKRADLKKALEDTLEIIRPEFGDRVEVVRSYGDLPDVPCYPKQLNQAFLSLLMNAAQAIDGEGEVRIETSRLADRAVIKISDNGRGIPSDQIERIFDPGFTTRGVGVGTGLGLSISYRIIENHNGRIHVESQVGKGSVFAIEIPLHADPPPPRPVQTS